MRRLIEVAIVMCLLNSVAWAQPVYFADPYLKAAVEAELGVTDPQVGHMLKLASLDAFDRGISDLTGLEYATNLNWLDLSVNQVSDLSLLAGLANLSTLYLAGNAISDISPLTGLTKLESLDVASNQISDLSPLAGLTNLHRLELSRNEISDLSPLAGLTNLTYLDLRINQISDLSPLAGLTNLDVLALDYNQISDLSPLARLTNLTRLGLWDNQISDLAPLAGLTNLHRLELGVNEISDLSPLAGLTNLTDLYLSENPLNQEACDVYIPQLEAAGVVVWHDCGTWPTVPDVVGLSESMAASTITWMGLTVGVTTSQCSDTVSAGNVISQNPAAGVLAPVGSPVNLTVSSGPCSLRVPNVVGMSESQAGSTLTSAGLTVGTKSYVESDTVPAGSVISQNPVAGRQVPSGSAVGLTISTGPATSPKVTVPNVVGMAQAAAQSTITSAGLVVGMVSQASSSTVPEGSVISQAPPAGTSLAKGSGVDLVVSSGPPEPTQVQVPNVVGMTQTAAEATVVAADLAVGTITHSQSQTVPEGQVISQNPQAGTQASPGWPVNLTVSTGSAPPGPILSDPVAHWRLDESTGTVARDETGKHHGTVYGHPIWLPAGGKLEGALLFDGADDYVDCGTFNPSAATGQLTVCLWAQWNGLNGWYQGLIGKRDSFNAQAMMWQVETTLDTGHLTFKQAGDPGIGAPALPVGEWTHVGATFDGSTARLYLNGNQSSSGAFSLGLGATTQVVFGACEKNGNNPFNGALDDVRLYDEALSEDQIQAVMTPPATIVWDRAAYWDTRYPSTWVHGSSVRDALDLAGYTILDADQLKAWMDARIADGAPAVVVFCQDVAPDTVYEAASWTCTLRQYLNAGGKIVWYGDIPLYCQGHNDGTTTAFEVDGSISVLGFNAASGTWDSGEQVTLTDEGRAWGLTQTWPSVRPALSSGLRALARDSSGQAAAWVKHFLPGDTYRGFVRFSDCGAVPDVMDVRRLAVYPMAPGATGPGSADLVAHWALDETSGRVAAESVNGVDGVTVGGPVWQPGGGKVGGALNFDGVNDSVVTDFVLDPADGPFSVFAWVKGGRPGQVILSQDGSQAGLDWLVADPAGRLMTRLGGTGSGRFGTSLSSTTVITDGRWHEVGLVWDGANRTLYVDGVAVAEDRQTQLRGSTGGLNIGAGKDLDAGAYWSGLIDEVRIYNQAVRP